jgi:Zn-dependent peptidase ImmA (M78 family)
MPRRTKWHEDLVLRLIEQHDGAAPEDIIEAFATECRVAAGETQLPIRPSLVASYHGIRLRRAKHNFAGRIYAEPTGQLVMDINESDPAERQHFTEAHELIHTAFPDFDLDHRYRLDATMDRYAENHEEEYLCDLGAAALLMPAELVADAYPVRRGLEAVESLSQDAQVSIEAAANRIVALSDEPAVMLCLAWGHKPAEQRALREGAEVPKRLRVRYAVTSHMDLYVPKFKGADDESVFCKAAASYSIVRETTTLPGADEAGLFRVEAKRYGTAQRERVIAVCRPTA